MLYSRHNQKDDFRGATATGQRIHHRVGDSWRVQRWRGGAGGDVHARLALYASDHGIPNVVSVGHLQIAAGDSGLLRDPNGAEWRRITLERCMNPATATPADARFAVYVAMRQVDAHAVTTWPPVRALADVALWGLQRSGMMPSLTMTRR